MSSSNENKRKFTSVGWIIFWFIVFYPLGYVFLFLRLKDKFGNKYTAVNKDNEEIKVFKPGTGYEIGKKFMIFGGAVFALAALGMFSNAVRYGFADDIVRTVAYAGISALLLYSAYKRAENQKRYQPYLNYLTAYGTDPIFDLAYSLGVTREQAIKDLSEMIQKKIIRASISEDGYIVLDANPEKIPSSSRYETKFVRCNSCGAPNAIKPGAPRKCEYCDSPLD